MKTITVTASKTYDITIGRDLFTNITSYLPEQPAACKAVMISDSNVWPLYGELICSKLLSASLEVLHYVFPAGEAQKSGSTYLSILEFLAENRITRSDMIIALGGGVVGDLAGFVAATYLRGITYIQIPTTLLSMVDSSVGGKTAIDLNAGKNLAGAFYQPSAVICDLSALDTLPSDVFTDGCAEVIKYATLFDESLFSHLERYGSAFDREYVVACCVGLKRQVVIADEFDHGIRQSLNLGHTFGHSIEALSQFSVSHGRAVAIGTAIAARAAAHANICSTAAADRICRLLDRFSLPVRTEFSSEQLSLTALTDKKRTGDTVNLIFPREIGAFTISPTPVEQLKSIIETGL